MPADALTYLFSLEQFGIKFGLDNIRAIVERLGHPDRTFRSVHVAGTNGKGSVTAMVDAALRAAGHRSARYTSPHLVDVTERFAIDGRPVDRAALAMALDDVRRAVDSLRHEGVLQVSPTFFEVTTAAAFELFRRAGTEVAVLEVGLGGRLDATNVVSPIVSAITSIAFDHETYLGRHLRDIAGEKAGIIKPGVPVVVGPIDSEPISVIEAVAHERGAKIVHASAADADGFTVALQGSHQRVNAGIAVKLLQTLDAMGVTVSRSAIAAGLANPEWPGRLDLRRLSDGREVLLDAAHNPAGAASLASYVRDASLVGIPLVFAVMRDKDVAAILRALEPVVGPIVLTRASNRRSAEPDALLRTLGTIAPGRLATLAATPEEALEAAWRMAPRILVAGSIFLLGDVLGAIGPTAEGRAS